VIGQPDPVVGAEEQMAFGVHAGRVDPQQDGFATAGADVFCGLLIVREVDMLTRSLDQTLAPDGVEKRGHGAVQEGGRRFEIEEFLRLARGYSRRQLPCLPLEETMGVCQFRDT